MVDSWWMNGGFMVGSWWIHGGFMVDSWWMNGTNPLQIPLKWWIHGKLMEHDSSSSANAGFVGIPASRHGKVPRDHEDLSFSEVFSREY